ncbi:MAG: ATP-binding protein [Endomicrobia bacterium]|nr:ATP-binding protein [Endomicrobiia bacterium]
MSYGWIILFAVTFAVIKFSKMFTPGGVYTVEKYSLYTSFMLFSAMSFFFMASKETYLRFKPEKKFLNYIIISCAFAGIITGLVFGIKWFNISVFVFMWMPASVIMAVSIYYMTKTEKYDRLNIFFILAFFIAYCIVYLASEAGMLFGLSVKFQAICDAMLSVIVFSIGAVVFKYYKVSHEKHVRIYDYLPVYWRHIPIGSILFMVLVGGLFFAMYLENYSINNIEKNSRNTVSNIAGTITSKLAKADQISLALSQTPFLVEGMLHPEESNRNTINKMLETYRRIFDVSVIFTMNNAGNIVFYSDLLSGHGILKTNLKHRPYFTSAKNLKRGSVLYKSLTGEQQSYFSSHPILPDGNAMSGVVIVQYDVDDISEKLKQFKNIFIVDKYGIVLLADNDESYFGYLWPLYSAETSDKNETDDGKFLSKEVFDGDVVIVNGEPFFVARQFINETDWSVIYFSSLSPVSQFKILNIAGVSSALIIILLLFWSINQSNRILALALQHKAILNSAKSIMIVSTDVHGRIIVYGEGAEDILGYTKDEFINKGIENIIFKEGAPITFEDAVAYSSIPSVEIMCRRKDGTFITILISVLPQFSVKNKLIGYIFSGVDITATKEFETELGQQIKFLQMLIDSMPIAVYYKDSEMRLIGCNRAYEDIMEHSKNFMIGRLAKEIYFDGEAEKESERTDKIATENLSSITYEKVVRFRKSGPRNLIYYKSAYRKIDGNFGGIIGVIIDATYERKMQKERDALQANLIQQNKLASLGELAGSIAHELNNPLSIILGFAQVLIKDTSLGEETRKGIENIYEAAKRSKSVVTNMLEFSRTDTAKNQFVRINDIIESTMLIIDKDFRKTGIEIEKNLTKDNRSVLANPMQIQQVLLNVLLNAKDSMPSGGKVTVRTEIKDKYFVIDIADTGSGIPKEIMSKIFDPFFTTKAAGKGTGLGLSICYGIVNAHKGDISVKSTINKGTVFSIKLPLN